MAQLHQSSRRSAPPEPRDGFPFEAFRQVRFRDGVCCPHCSGSHVQRWGTFSGRQRYRCLECRRTFSDFTGTSLAYVKRISAWPRYCQCLRDSMTIRASAATATVSTATSFRWRHRILMGLDRADRGPLGPVIVLGETWFQESQKGSRTLDRPARHRAITHPSFATPVWVLLARDGENRVAGCVLGSSRPRPSDVVTALGSRLVAGARLVSRSGWYGAPAVAADRLGVPHRRTPPRSPEMRHVQGYALQLKRWMRRFRGVAVPRYLSSYLVWHRFLDGSTSIPDGAGEAGATVWRWGLPTVPANRIRVVHPSLRYCDRAPPP